jgi:hypothetical protein
MATLNFQDGEAAGIEARRAGRVFYDQTKPPHLGDDLTALAEYAIGWECGWRQEDERIRNAHTFRVPDVGRRIVI